MSRILFLDTETTGFHPSTGHKIIEIAIIETINGNLNGKYFHHYINPEYEIDEDAEAVHGITSDFLVNKPFFDEIVDSFLTFIGNDLIVTHNVPFDLSFVNAELVDCGKSELLKSQFYCTLRKSRRLFPGQKNSLSVVCKRVGIEFDEESLHGALADASLVAQLYFAIKDIDEPQKRKSLTRKSTIILPTVGVSPIWEKNIVFSGSFKNMTRNEAKTYAQMLGANVFEAISGKTDILITGVKTGNKVKQAENLGVTIMTEMEWLSLVDTLGL